MMGTWLERLNVWDGLPRFWSWCHDSAPFWAVGLQKSPQSPQCWLSRLSHLGLGHSLSSLVLRPHVWQRIQRHCSGECLHSCKTFLASVNSHEYAIARDPVTNTKLIKREMLEYEWLLSALFMLYTHYLSFSRAFCSNQVYIIKRKFEWRGIRAHLLFKTCFVISVFSFS